GLQTFMMKLRPIRAIQPPGSTGFRAIQGIVAEHIEKCDVCGGSGQCTMCKGTGNGGQCTNCGVQARVLNVRVLATENPSARSNRRPHCAQVNRLPLRRPSIIVTVYPDGR